MDINSLEKTIRNHIGLPMWHQLDHKLQKIILDERSKDYFYGISFVLPHKMCIYKYRLFKWGATLVYILDLPTMTIDYTEDIEIPSFLLEYIRRFSIYNGYLIL
jgi:hypothetical protein